MPVPNGVYMMSKTELPRAISDALPAAPRGDRFMTVTRARGLAPCAMSARAAAVRRAT